MFTWRNISGYKGVTEPNPAVMIYFHTRKQLIKFYFWMYPQSSWEDLQSFCICKFEFLTVHCSANTRNCCSWNCAPLGSFKRLLLRNPWLCVLAAGSCVGGTGTRPPTAHLKHIPLVLALTPGCLTLANLHTLNRLALIRHVNRFANFYCCHQIKQKNSVFWDITQCGSCKNRRFGGT
jgi:hypothetical protein